MRKNSNYLSLLIEFECDEKAINFNSFFLRFFLFKCNSFNALNELLFRFYSMLSYKLDLFGSVFFVFVFVFVFVFFCLFSLENLPILFFAYKNYCYKDSEFHCFSFYSPLVCLFSFPLSNYQIYFNILFRFDDIN